MIKFIGGPAADKVLALKRSPLVLRVVINAAGEVDALDAPDDEAKPRERIYLYMLASDVRVVFIRPGGAYPIAEYEFRAEQPDEAIMRDNDKFVDWCESNRATLFDELRAAGKVPAERIPKQ